MTNPKRVTQASAVVEYTLDENAIIATQVVVMVEFVSTLIPHIRGTQVVLMVEYAQLTGPKYGPQVQTMI